jgi:carbon-monoxide dehydrogenase medium subunit
MTTLATARPADLASLAALMAGAVPIRFIAGGTDLLLSRRALPREALLVDLTAVNGLAGIETDDSDIVIGGATTVAALEAHASLAARYPALVQAAAECGSVQIRNRATLAGNIANAAPAAEPPRRPIWCRSWHWPKPGCGWSCPAARAPRWRSVISTLVAAA